VGETILTAPAGRVAERTARPILKRLPRLPAPFNPSAFQRCVESVTADGSARDPRAVCAVAGVRKYGQAEMTRRAVAARKQPAKLERCVEAVTAKGGAVSPYAVCTAALKRSLEAQKLRAGRNPMAKKRQRRNSAVFNVRGRRWQQEWYETGDSEIKTRATALRKRGYRVMTQYMGPQITQSGQVRMTLMDIRPGTSGDADLLKLNPAEAADQAYEEFHGEPPRELLTVRKKVHYHRHLTGAGALHFLVVRGVDHQTHRIRRFGDAVLAFNETKNQLFIEGGNQQIDLNSFGITEPHELETLGKVLDIGYHTDKKHLGDEGGRATYTHTFRTTNLRGRHVVVTVARYPDLIYDVPNEQLLFAGGSYTIKAEGIDK
jgi:hypothetical protein